MIDTDKLADLLGLEKDKGARVAQIYSHYKKAAIEAAEFSNESLETKGKILRSKQAIEIAAHEVAISMVMQQLIMEKMAEDGSIRREMAQVFNSSGRTVTRILESVGVFDKLPDEESFDD